MAEHTPTNPHAGKPGAANAARNLSCEEWEALLVDFLDGALQPGEAGGFHAHRESCSACAEIFAQAAQGREWLHFLRVEPHAPPVLVAKILARTSGSVSNPRLVGELATPSAVVIPIAPALPFWKRTGVGLSSRRVVQPRLLMTAAMAFFSITLTLNMAGVRLTAIHLADLKPAALSGNLDRQYYMASARVVRYYDNLRFFYEMEAKVRELRRDADMENSAPAEPQSQPAPAAAPPNAAPKSGGGKSQAPSNPGSSHTRAMFWGEQVEAALGNPLGEIEEEPSYCLRVARRHSESGIEHADSRAADRAERGIA